MSGGDAAFARDPATRRYYDLRAPEYDEWYLGEGLFSRRERPGWETELADLVALLTSLPAARTLDVACGTGFLSRHLRGPVVGVDRSAAMVRVASGRLRAVAVGDALDLPVASGVVDRVFTAHFYGHLPPAEQARFLDEARRLAGELLVVDTARRPGTPPESWQERLLNDGSRHRVFKRFLTAGQLASEIGGAPLFSGRWFVVARAGTGRAGPRRPRRSVGRPERA